AVVLEQHDGVLATLLEAPVDLGADPLLGPVDHLPAHPSGGVGLEDLHVEAADVAEAEGDRAPDVGGAGGVGGPPGGEALRGGHGLPGDGQLLAERGGRAGTARQEEVDQGAAGRVADGRPEVVVDGGAHDAPTTAATWRARLGRWWSQPLTWSA